MYCIVFLTWNYSRSLVHCAWRLPPFSHFFAGTLFVFRCDFPMHFQPETESIFNNFIIIICTVYIYTFIVFLSFDCLCKLCLLVLLWKYSSSLLVCFLLVFRMCILFGSLACVCVRLCMYGIYTHALQLHLCVHTSDQNTISAIDLHMTLCLPHAYTLASAAVKCDNNDSFNQSKIQRIHFSY